MWGEALSPGGSVVGCYVVLSDCMQVSKRRRYRGHNALQGLCAQPRRYEPPECQQADSGVDILTPFRVVRQQGALTTVA